MSKLYTAKETAEILGIKESTVRKWVLEKRIPYVKVGTALRFNANEIEKIVSQGLGIASGK